MTSGEMMRFVRNWQKAFDWKKSLDRKSLKKGFVRLLLLRGSLTKRLEALSGEAIEAELSKALRRGLAKDEGAYLISMPGEDSIEREVWLKAGGKRLVYARSVFPSSLIGEKIRGALKTSKKPLGSVLSLENIGVKREALELAVITDKKISKGFGFKKEVSLFARRYRLIGLKKNGAKRIKGIVQEVFGPALAPVKGVRFKKKAFKD
ncbi:MAG: chorismate lyase [Thermodesulfobacteriota bacterium]